MKYKFSECMCHLTAIDWMLLGKRNIYQIQQTQYRTQQDK